MNHTASSCTCGSAEPPISVPFFFLAICLSLSSIISSFYTHKKVLALEQQHQSMEGHKEYGKMLISSSP